MKLNTLTYDQLHTLYWRVEFKKRDAVMFSNEEKRLSGMRDKIASIQHERFKQYQKRMGWK